MQNELENGRTIEALYQNEQGIRAEILEDRHRIKQGFQSNLTISGVLLGLLLNLAKSQFIDDWALLSVVLLIIATVLLIGSAILSLVFQFTSRKPAGYLDSQALYDKFAMQDLPELRRYQLANLIKIRKSTLPELYRLSCWANINRALIVASVLLIGIALILELWL